MYKVLFVCSGATCRSPMASILFNRKIKEQNLSGVKSDYSGLAVEYGSNISLHVKMALKEYGIMRTSGHPCQITGRHLAEHNLIICVTDDHAEALKVMSADKFKDKIFSFNDICGVNIPDPYGKDFGTYQKCLAQISNALDNLIKVLKNQNIIKQKRNNNV